MSRDCIFKVTTLAGQVDAGTVTLDGDQITAVATSGYRTLMDHVLAMGVVRSSKIKIAKWQDDPTAWFEALPYQYSGSYLRAAIVVKKVKKYSDDEPRDDHGMWTSEGGVSVTVTTEHSSLETHISVDDKTVTAVTQWTHSSTSIRAEVLQSVQKGELPPEGSSARVIYDGIRHGETIDQPLYRGLYGDTPAHQASIEQLKHMKEGETIQIAEPSSFSTERGTSINYASRGGDTNRLLIEVDKGAKGMNLDHVDPVDAGVLSENEVITFGNFKVKGLTSYTTTGGHQFDVLHLQHVAVL